MADDDKANKDGDPPEDDEDDDKEPFEAPDEETWTKTTESLSKANAEAKKWRLRAQGKDPKWKPAPPPPDDEDEPDDEEAKAKKPSSRRVRKSEEQIRREAEEAALAKAKPGLVKSAARDALKDAGLIVPAKNADAAYQRAIRLLDMAEIDVDEDGEVSGVTDQVKQVKRDYPELFATKGGRRVNAGAGSGKTGDDKDDKGPSSADKLAAMLTGG